MEIKDIAQLIIASLIVHVCVIAAGIFLFLNEKVTGFLKFSFISVAILGGCCLIISALALSSPANAVAGKLSMLTGLYVIAFLIGGGASASGIAKGSQYFEDVLKDRPSTIALFVVALCVIVYLLLGFLMIRANESIGALRRKKLLTGLSLWAHMGDYGDDGSNTSDFESDREYSSKKKSKKPSFSNKKRSKNDKNVTTESSPEEEPILRSGHAAIRAKPSQYV
jgi:hypothetical protein